MVDFDPSVDALLSELLLGVEAVLGGELLGVYLFGSLARGEFDPGVSDLDLLAVCGRELDAGQLDGLRSMHGSLIAGHPDWYERVDVAYVPAEALRTFRERVSRIAVISPGEAFHEVEAGRDWLINWRPVREQGVALRGPPAATFIDPISWQEFAEGARENGLRYRGSIGPHSSSRTQSYVTLTLCRALYAWEEADQVSKATAAGWASREFPEWKDLLADALAWRRGEPAGSKARPDSSDAHVRTARFVKFATARLESAS